MDKKDTIVIAVIAFIAIAIAYVLNISLTHFSAIRTVVTTDNWLLFWGSYIGGVATLIAVFLTIRQNTKNNDRLVKQQNDLIERQYKEKKIEQYNKSLRNNLELLNIADTSGILATIRHSDLVKTKEAIVKKKSLIFSFDLQFRYVSKVDLFGCSSQTEQAYYAKWIEARQLLSDILDLQLSFIERVAENQHSIDLRKSLSGMITIQRQQEETMQQKGLSVDTAEYQNLLSDIINNITDHKKADKSILKFQTDINFIIEKITPQSETLTKKSKELFDLSVLLIEEKEASVSKL